MRTDVHVAIYFDSERIGPWDWQAFDDGALCLSGTDRATLLLARSLASLGVSVTLYSASTPAAPDHMITVAATSLAAAARAAAATSADLIVFMNRNDQPTLAGLSELERVGLPCVVWDQNGPTPSFARRFEQSAVIRRLVVVSRAQADWIRDRQLFRRTQVVYNAAVPGMGRSCTTGAPQRVVYIGAVTPEKGFHHVARVWPKIHRRFPAASLHVVGSAKLHDRAAPVGTLAVANPAFESQYIVPFLGPTQDDARALGVHFLGLLGRRDTDAQIAAASVGLVNPNTTGSVETFCVSAIEFQAAGVPVVGGRAGGLKETVVDGRTGILVRDDRELEDALAGLLDTPTVAARMGRAGPGFIRERFAPDVIAGTWLTLLGDVLNGASAAPPRLDLRRSDVRTLLREAARRAADLPFVGRHVPSLDTLRALVRKGRSP